MKHLEEKLKAVQEVVRIFSSVTPTDRVSGEYFTLIVNGSVYPALYLCGSWILVYKYIWLSRLKEGFIKKKEKKEVTR